MALGVLGGTLHGIPFGVSTPVMYYNADLFKAARLNADQPPQTWDELQRQGAIIRQKTGKLAVYLPQPNDEWIDPTFSWRNGGRPPPEDGKRTAWDAPAATTPMQSW